MTSYAPGAPRPFNAAIMQSGVYAYLPYPDCNNDDYGAWNHLTHDLNCTGTDTGKFNCVQHERSAKQIKDAQELNRNISFAQACDNITAVLDPRLRVEAGNIADVPVIIGTNTQDGGVYTIRFGNDTDAYFNTYFPGMVILKDAVLAAYPLGSGGRTDEQMRLQQIQTDWNFHCVRITIHTWKLLFILQMSIELTYLPLAIGLVRRDIQHTQPHLPLPVQCLLRKHPSAVACLAKKIPGCISLL